MWTGTIITDANGIVLFEPTRLRAFYGGAIAAGTDLYARFLASDEGDQVLAQGLVVPLHGIDDAGYEVVAHLAAEPWQPPGRMIVENGVFPLAGRERLVLADVAVLRSWADDLDWRDLTVAPGFYGVTVRGFQALAPSGKAITRAGYEYLLAPCATLPTRTADLSRTMQVPRFDRGTAGQLP
jgi:hypothetical protein